MPCPYVHMSVARHAASGLAKYSPPASKRLSAKWSGADLAELARVMHDHPNYTALGAIGPDLFFFLPDFRDWKGLPTSSFLIVALDLLEKLYEELEPFIKTYEKYLGPITEDQAEEMSRLTGGLSESFGSVLSAWVDMLITALETWILESDDRLAFFSLGMNRGYDEQAYFWSDMLHYRATGRFARALYKRAVDSGDEASQAYALGYVTHVATDTAGHPYVNEIVGGPFREHWQRHHLTENHVDSAWYLSDTGGPRSASQYPQLTESALYYDVAFGAAGAARSRPTYPTGDTMRENWERERSLDIDSELPDAIAKLLLGAIEDVFYDGTEKHPAILRANGGRPTEALIKEAYKLLFRYLKLTTVDGFDHEAPDPPEVWGNLDFPTYTDPAEDGPDEDDDSFWDDLWKALLAILAALLYAFEVAEWLFTLPWAVLSDLFTYPARYLLWMYESTLFTTLKQMRYLLVMTGYMLPMDDEISTSLIHVGKTASRTWSEVLEDLGDEFGGLDDTSGSGSTRFTDDQYPHAHPEDEYQHPWDYPTDAVTEKRATVAGPFAEGADPSRLFGGVGPDASILEGLSRATGEDDAKTVGDTVTPARHLGDPTGFAQYLLWLTTRDATQKGGTKVPLVDWNLDGDRGYGYRTWDWDRRDATSTDPEGKTFHQPCTWPQQAAGEVPEAPEPWDATDPMRIHWVGPGLTDPGCGRQLTVGDIRLPPSTTGGAEHRPAPTTGTAADRIGPRPKGAADRRRGRR